MNMSELSILAWVLGIQDMYGVRETGPLILEYEAQDFEFHLHSKKGPASSNKSV